MHVEKIHFDEVFDAVAEDGNFSFRSHGRTHYGVKLQKHVIPRAGSTFAIAFAEPGNWSTVLGWRDLASTDVVFARPASFWLYFAVSDIVMYALFVDVGGLCRRRRGPGGHGRVRLHRFLPYAAQP
jgi:hypothetical protein